MASARKPQADLHLSVAPAHDARVGGDHASAAPNASTSRAARALIGWMSPDAAHAALTLLADQAASPVDYAGRARAAREAVAARARFTPPVDAVHEPTETLARYGDALWQDPGVAQFVGEGWRVATVDVRRACPLHPVVFVEHASDRVSEADPDDIISLA